MNDRTAIYGAKSVRLFNFYNCHVNTTLRDTESSKSDPSRKDVAAQRPVYARDHPDHAALCRRLSAAAILDRYLLKRWRVVRVGVI